MARQTNEYHRAWRAANPEKVLAADRRAKLRNRDKRLGYDRTRKVRDPLKYSWAIYRRNAKKRGLMFTLTRQEHDGIVLQPCVYCGALADPTNGIDRVDNSTGYLIENSSPCCRTCNFMRGSLGREPFIEQVARIAARMGI